MDGMLSTMSGAVPLEHDALVTALLDVAADERWGARLRDILIAETSSAVHVAVMHEPFLALLLLGRKTVESRFSIRRVAPFEEVQAGDVLALKAQSGPLLGLALVEHAAFYELDPDTLEHIRSRFAERLCVDGEFWAQRARARYGSLMRLTDVVRIPPVRLAKRDRRGWVRLKPRTGIALAS